MNSLTRRVEQRAANMAAMMLHLGIWPETSSGGLVMESAIRTCFFCRRADRCSHWLADCKVDPMAWQRFCPNAKLFTRLRRKSVEEMLYDPRSSSSWRVMACGGRTWSSCSRTCGRARTPGAVPPARGSRLEHEERSRPLLLRRHARPGASSRTHASSHPESPGAGRAGDQEL
jgi:Family of unknown function (DUF6455)